MNPRRWPAIGVLAAVLASLIAFDQTAEVPAAPNPPERVAVAVPDDGAPSATWFCAGGALGTEPGGDHRIIVGNGTSDRVRVDLTVFPADLVVAPPPAPDPGGGIDTDLLLPPPEADPGDPVSVTLTLDAGADRTVRLADVAGVEGDIAAALVETRGGVVVEHQVTSGASVATSPCSTSSAQSWLVAGGSTRTGARTIVSVFNPFAVDAVVNLQFATPNGIRRPNAYESLPVAPRSVLAVDITDVVTLADSVATLVDVRGGRVVVDRIVTLDEPDVASGVSLSLATPTTREQWVFASARPDADRGDVYAVYNPGEFEARVDLEVHLDPLDRPLAVEPVSLTVRPGAVELVVLTPTVWPVAGSNVTDASARVRDDEIVGPLTYWVGVRTLNDVGVAVDRLTGDAAAVTGVGEVGWVAGTSVAAGTWLTTTADLGALVLVNPSTDTIAVATISVPGSQGTTDLVTVEIAPGGRQVVDAAALGVAAGTLMVNADRAIAVEVVAASGNGGRPASPLGASIERLDLPVPATPQ